MDWNRHGAAIGMSPPLVASGLSMLDESEATGHRWNSRAVALGIHDFSRILGQRSATLLILLGDHVEDVPQLRQGLFSSGHQGVATSEYSRAERVVRDRDRTGYALGYSKDDELEHRGLPDDMVLACSADLQADNSRVKRDDSIDVLGIENGASSRPVDHGLAPVAFRPR
jgi:hypothetical protein